MKHRYFILPLVIISLILLVIDYNKEIVNKTVFSDNKEINYPFFNDDKIDKYINNYLNEYIENDSENNIFIDYDYIDNDDLCYMTFYKYILNGNVISSNSDSFEIDIENSSIIKVKNTSFDFDFVTSRKIDTDKKLVALTFDDGPNYNTNKILDVLNKYHVPATFFVLGSKIKGNEYILNKMKDSGMEIGNHTYNHLLLTKYKEDKIKKEITDTNNLIFEVTGKEPKLFRPSYGSFNKKIKNISEMPIIIWDIDTLDWKYHNSKKITSRVINKVKDGDIVLMHDIYSATANALDNIIPILIDKGYSFVTVSDLFYYKGITLEKGKVYGYAR
ncbi:MAG: polysaccharide deacetylase family protein [Bacilli bacterium]